MRDKTRQVEAASRPLPNKQKLRTILSFFEEKKNQFKTWGCGRKRNNPERRRSDTRRPGLCILQPPPPAGSEALFLEEEAEMESGCRHRLIAVLLIKSLCSETTHGGLGAITFLRSLTRSELIRRCYSSVSVHLNIDFSRRDRECSKSLDYSLSNKGKMGYC